MTRLAIVVEGSTETEFVDNMLVPYLSERGVYPFPYSLDGNVSVARLAHRMAGFLHSADCVTSLVDFYGFRHRNNATPDQLENMIDQAVKQRTTRSWDRRRVFSYVQQYEFEGLLFSNVNAFAVLPFASDRTVPALQEVRSQFPTPEAINGNPNTAPSKRIERVMHRYNKRRDGYLVAEEIGLDTIRAQCPRFSQWVARLQALGNPAGAP